MTLRVAVVGAGIIGREHLARLRGHARARAVALVDPAPASMATAAAAGCAHHATLEALLAGPLPDAAIVATPNALHVPQALALVARGVPVLVEKPVADTVAAGLALARAAHERGVPVLVGHHRRHSAALQAAQACVAAGRLGRLVAVNATTLFHKPAAYFDVAWRRGPAGGPVLINAVHDVDSLRALAGEIVAVQARCAHAARGFEVEDSAAVILEFANGALGTLIVSDAAVAPRSWEHTSGENPMYPHQPGEDAIFLAGTQGSLAVPTLRLWRQEAAPSWAEPFDTERLAIRACDPLDAQLDHFCDVVERRATPRVDAADATATLAATLAIREAAELGARVALSSRH